ncbi:CPBP family intramembrane glutamic endopeptidase [Stomatobaculum sp.]
MSEMSAIGKRSGIADLLAVFFLPLAANLSASLLLKLVPGAETALRFNALCQGCLLLFAFVRYRQGGGGGAREKRCFPLFEFAGTLFLYLLLIFLLVRSGYAASDRNYQTALRSLGRDGERETLIFYALCGAAAEEFLFRGILERGLAVFLKRRWLTACIAALLFALYHGNLTQGLLAFPLGLAFSRLKARGGLRASLAAHLCINLLALFV